MEDFFKQALKSALGYLERGDHFENELALKLQKKGFDESVITQVLLFLKEKKFLNDEKVLSNVIDYRLRVKKEGRYKIIQNLTRRGVTRESIDAILKDSSLEEMVTSAVVCLEKKFKKEFDRQKGYRFLGSRGYESAIIEKALNCFFEENYEQL